MEMILTHKDVTETNDIFESLHPDLKKAFYYADKVVFKKQANIDGVDYTTDVILKDRYKGLSSTYID